MIQANSNVARQQANNLVSSFKSRHYSIEGSLALKHDLARVLVCANQPAAQLSQDSKGWEAAFERSPLPSLITDSKTGKCVAVNEEMLALLGLSSNDMLGHTALELNIWPGPFQRRGIIRRVKKHGSLRDFEVSIHVDEKRLSVLANVESMELNEQPCYLTQLVDITHRRQLEETLRLTAAAVKHSGDALVIFDDQGAIMSVNPAFTRITGYDSGLASGKTLDQLLKPSAGRHDNTFFRKMLGSLMMTGKWKGETWIQHKDGQDSPVFLNLDAIRDDRGRVTNHVGVFTDIARLKQCEDDLKELALRDELTGLASRSLLMDRGEQALRAAARYGRNAAVLFARLDLFKTVNDACGRTVADELLKLAAQRLLSCVRAADTVARLSGDEFAIVLGQIDSSDSALVVARKVMAELDRPFWINGQELSITANISIANYPQNGLDMPTLLRRADEGLYSIKHSGGHSIWSVAA